MDLKFATKSLQDKEKTQTKDDTSYRTNKANLEKKEREIKAIEVRKSTNGRNNRTKSQKISHFFFRNENRIDCRALTMKMVPLKRSNDNVMH